MNATSKSARLRGSILAFAAILVVSVVSLVAQTSSRYSITLDIPYNVVWSGQQLQAGTYTVTYDVARGVPILSVQDRSGKRYNLMGSPGFSRSNAATAITIEGGGAVHAVRALYLKDLSLEFNFPVSRSVQLELAKANPSGQRIVPGHGK